MAEIKAQTGVCPICQSEEVSYGSLELCDNDVYYPVTCDKCGASFREFYELKFVGHYNITDSNNVSHGNLEV